MNTSRNVWIVTLPLLALACDAQSEDKGSTDDSSQVVGASEAQNPKTGPAADEPKQDLQGNDEENATYQSVVDRHFKLVDAVGYELVEGSGAGVSFYSDHAYPSNFSNQLTFGAGCNRHWGEYHFEGSTLIVPHINHYWALCDEPLEQQDEWFRQFFKSEPIVDVKDDGIVVRKGPVSLVFSEYVVEVPSDDGSGGSPQSGGGGD